MVNDFKTKTLFRVLTGVVALPVYFFALAADYFNSLSDFDSFFGNHFDNFA